MGGPTVTQVKSKSYSVEDFRSMVNYENTTNRGYVRNTTGKNGEIVLGKVSKHWYSLPFHGLRSGVDKAHNEQLRKKLVEALEADMKYVDQTGAAFKSLKDRIVYRKDGGTERTDSLSRTEIAAALKEHDLRFNSTAGRKNILTNLCVTLARAASYADVAAFQREVLKLDPNNDDWSVFCAETDQVDAKGVKLQKNGHVEMVKPEAEFRGFLHILEARAAEAKNVSEANSEIIETVKQMLTMGTDQKTLPETITSRLRAALETSLRQEINQLSQMAGAGVAQGYLRAFVDEIVPVAILRVKEDLQAFGIDPKNHPDEVEAYVNDHAGAKGLVEKAKSFFAQAICGHRDKAAWKDQLMSNFGNGHQIGDQLLRQFKIGSLQRFSNNVDWSKLPENTNDYKNFMAKILKGFEGAYSELKDEGLRDLFVKSFLVANYGDNPTEKVDIVDIFKDRMHDLRKNVEVALKVNLGERAVIDGEKLGTGSMDDRLQKIGTDGIKFLQQEGVSDWTINQLLTRSLPKIVNQNIGRSIETDRSMYLGGNSYEATMNRLLTTGKAIDKFWNGTLKKEFAKSYHQAERFITSLAKRQGWPVNDLMREIRASFEQEYMTMAETAIAEYLDDEVYNGDQAKNAERDLAAKFSTCSTELMGNVNMRLRAYAFTRTAGAQCYKTLSDSFGNARNELGKLNAAQTGDGRLSENELKQLASGSLSRKWNEIVLKNLPNSTKNEAFDEQLVAKITDEFTKAAKDEFDKVVAFKEKVLNSHAASCKAFVDFSIDDEKGVLHNYASLQKPGESAPDTKVIDGLKTRASNYLIWRSRPAVDELIEQFIRNPNSKTGQKRIDEQLQKVLDTNGKGEMQYGLTLFCKEHAIRVEKQLESLAPSSDVGRITNAVVVPDLKMLARPSNKPSGPDFFVEERSYVYAKTFGLHSERLYDHVTKFPLAYGDTSDSFLYDFTNYSVGFLRKTADEYNVYREAMLDAFKPIAENYSIPQEIKDKVLKDVLVDVVGTNQRRLERGQEEMVPVEEATKYFDKQMLNALHNIAHEKYEEYEVVSAAITKTYNKTVPNVKELFSEAGLRAGGLSPAVPATVVEKISSKMLDEYVERLNFQLTIDISSDPKRNLDKYAEEVRAKADAFIRQVTKDLNEWAVDQEKDQYARATVIELVEKSGDFSSELLNNEVYNLLCNNLVTWGKSTETNKTTTDIMNLIVDESWAKNVLGEENFVESKKLSELKQSLLDDLAKTTKSVINDIFSKTFDKNQSQAALQLVDQAVRYGWGLDVSGQTADKIREVVITRIKHLMEQETIGEDDFIFDLDLSGDGNGTMNKITDIINGIGMQEMIVGKSGNEIATKMAEDLKAEYPQYFDINDKDDLLVQQAKANNIKMLLYYVGLLTSEIGEEFVGEQEKLHYAKMNLAEFEDKVKRSVLNKTQLIVAKCMAREECAKQLPTIVGQVTQDYLGGLIEKINTKLNVKALSLDKDGNVRFDGVENLDNEKVKEQTKTFARYVKEQLDNRINLLQDEALKDGKTGDALGSLLKDGVNQLTVDLKNSEPPEKMKELGIDTKKKLIGGKTSWVDVFYGGLTPQKPKK